LISYLRGCGIRDLPMLAESVLVAVTSQEREEFLSLLEHRQPEMTPSPLSRLKKVIRSVPK
jgi:hypothetical protein